VPPAPGLARKRPRETTYIDFSWEEYMIHSSRKALRGAALLVTGALLVLVLGLNVAQAKNIAKQNLVQLMAHSTSIVIGTVTDKTDGFHRGLPYTEVTLDVAQDIKGQHGSTYTFRQFGLIAPRSMGDGRVNLMVTPAGWPIFAKGEQVMLFLHAPASETGFQTTAGLDQGKFSIRGSQVANGLGNQALFAGVTINAALGKDLRDLVNQAGGAYEAESFFTLVRRAVQENWIENGVMTDEN
jgi:hypothetical protein